jgi:hypothetical protein
MENIFSLFKNNWPLIVSVFTCLAAIIAFILNCLRIIKTNREIKEGDEKSKKKYTHIYIPSTKEIIRYSQINLRNNSFISLIIFFSFSISVLLFIIRGNSTTFTANQSDNNIPPIHNRPYIQPQSPKEINVKLFPNLSVELNWESVPEAKSYRVYWSTTRTDSLIKKNSLKTSDTSIKIWPEKFPKYYRITSIDGNYESEPSKPHRIYLLSDEGGTKCQICGKKAIGYCAMRHIYVCIDHQIFTSRDGTKWVCP